MPYGGAKTAIRVREITGGYWGRGGGPGEVMHRALGTPEVPLLQSFTPQLGIFRGRGGGLPPPPLSDSDFIFGKMKLYKRRY